MISIPGYRGRTRQKRRRSKAAVVDLWHYLLFFVFVPQALIFQLFDFSPPADRELSFDELDQPAILLPQGTRVPDDLDNPELWRDWIEEIRGTPLPREFCNVAHIFKEEGKKLGIFWPAVLVQSLHETNFYRYGGRARKENFNAGGVGITPEDRTTTRQNFGTLRAGVRAMLEHVAIYADPYRMEKVIREQNSLERGHGRFTARRTEEMFGFIREKFDRFRRQWPDRLVRITDLGSWAPEKKVKQMGGNDEHGLTHQPIQGASLAYAEDPFYSTKLYRWWHEGSSYVRSRYTESQPTANKPEAPYPLQSIHKAALKISLLLFPLKLSFY